MSALQSVASSTTPSSSLNAAAPATVEVQRGDTLSAIAARQGVSLQAMIDANPQLADPDLIHPGEQLFVPNAAAAATETRAATPVAAAEARAASGLSLSAQGLDLIKGYEGLRLDAYQDSAGVWTVGYGHTGGVRPGDSVTRAQAEQLLRGDVAWAEQAVRDNVRVPLSQGQFDALVSFTFNVGAGALQGSTLLARLNQGDYAGAQAEFGRWVHAGGERLDGLVRRRAEEAALFGGSAPAGDASAGTPADSPRTSAAGSYTVRRGDTLSAIAATRGLSLQALIAANPQIRDPDLIFAGQQLRLPGGSAPAAAPQADTGGNAPPGAVDVPLYRQGDPAWGSRTLGSNRSVAAAGCAMTSMAMALSAVSGRNISPGTLDSWLDANGGYAGDAIYWDKAAQIVGAHAAKAPWSLQAIDSQLAAGRPVVVGVDSRAGSGGGANGTDHWIAVTGRGTVDGQTVYYANDPASGRQITLRPDGGQLAGQGIPYRTTGELVVISGG